MFRRDVNLAREHDLTKKENGERVTMHISPVLWQFLVKWLNASALFPREASTIAPYADALYFFLLLITVVGLTFVGCLIFGFAIRYRKERHPVAIQVEGSTLLEATWTIIPLALFLIVFVWGALLYFRIYNPPTNAMNIYIVGKQWMWKAEHPGGQQRSMRCMYRRGVRSS